MEGTAPRPDVPDGLGGRHPGTDVLADGSKPVLFRSAAFFLPEGFPVDAAGSLRLVLLKTYEPVSAVFGTGRRTELRGSRRLRNFPRGNPASPDEILVTSVVSRLARSLRPGFL